MSAIDNDCGAPEMYENPPEPIPDLRLTHSRQWADSPSKIPAPDFADMDRRAAITVSALAVKDAVREILDKVFHGEDFALEGDLLTIEEAVAKIRELAGVA